MGENQVWRELARGWEDLLSKPWIFVSGGLEVSFVLGP